MKRIEEVQNKKKIVGLVVSNKPEKTVVVEVQAFKKHPIYDKRIKWSKKYMAHDSENSAKEGDVVELIESKPYSARKRFVLLKIIEKKVV